MEIFTKLNEKFCPLLDNLTKNYRQHLFYLWNLKTQKLTFIFVILTFFIQTILIGISIHFEKSCQLLVCRNLVFFRPCKKKKKKFFFFFFF